MSSPHGRCAILSRSLAAGFALIAAEARGQLVATPLADVVLDAAALVLGEDGSFARTINGSPFQQSAILSHAGYQYAAWYRNGADDEDLYIGRRSLDGGGWQVLDTGRGLENGDATNASAGQVWDAHNVVSLGVSGDGRLHLAFDHHGDPLRYLTTEPGVAVAGGGPWDASIFNPERRSLNVGGSDTPSVTYPRFTALGGGLAFTYRVGGSTSGEHFLARYDTQTGAWTAPQRVINGLVGTHTDASGATSTSRNGYLNGVSVDPSGRMHITWTWREKSGGNHDIHYTYSDDNGVTWRNNAGQQVGSPTQSISLNSPGIEVVALDDRQALINQQGQAVDADGGVHAVMYHRRQEPGFEWVPGDSVFSTEDAAYHHYYRNPTTGVWSVSQLPLAANERVGSRPSAGVDAAGNVYALYTQNNDLVIAGAEKTSGGFSPWRVLHRDTRNFEGTPNFDRQRLLEEGILSVFLQERPTVTFANAASQSPLRVLDFRVGTTPIAGDYNIDGRVDAADYVVWRDASRGGASHNPAADGDGDGVVDRDDYLLWKSRFGAVATTPARARATPEPAGWMVAGGLVLIRGTRRVRSV